MTSERNVMCRMNEPVPRPGARAVKPQPGTICSDRGWKCIRTEQEDDMDKDRIAGAAKQAKGAIKDAAGKVTGDTKMQAEGKADKAMGKAQNAVGGAKDAMRGKK